MGEGFAVGLCAFRVGLQPPRISRLGHLARSEGERTQCRLRFRRMKLKTVPLKKARGERIGRAVRTAQFRLVEWKVPGTAATAADLELYDYVKDPLETKNVASDQPEVVARMRALLAKLPEARPQFRAARPQQN